MKSWLRALQRWLLRRPRGVAMGEGSTMRRPWTLTNRHLIAIGNRTRIGRDAILNPMTCDESGLAADGRIVIGDDVYIGPHSQIHACRGVRIGDGAVLSDYVYLNDASHGLDPRAGLIMAQPIECRGEVVIGRHVFLGLRSVVFSGVELGDHCVVGANAVVTRSFPAHSMIAGAPARLIKRYDVGQQRWIAAGRGAEAAA
jgi:acetyltransferase-like isoleucine patch superfamily enzyme